MSSSIIDIAEAIVAKLKAATLPMTAEKIERKYIPEYDLADIKQLRIAVAPMAIDPRTRLTREADQVDAVISIGIMRKLSDTAEATDLDPYVSMSLATSNLLADGMLAEAPDAKLISLVHSPLVEMTWFKNYRSFFSLITTTWRTTEAVRAKKAGS